MNQVQKQIDKSEGYIRQNEVANPFGQNVSAAILYKKVERIVVATTYVTSQIKDNPVLKGDVQSVTSEMLREAIVLKDGFRVTGTDKVSNLLASLRMLMTYTDVLRAAGYISDSNLELLKSACARLVSLMRSGEQSALAESFTLSEELLGKGHEYVREESVAEQSADVRALRPVQRTQSMQVNAPVRENTPKADTKSSYIPKGNSERRTALLTVIESRGAVTIRDLASVVPGISEKTIQRELQAMIVDGVLKKEGDRRWTTYSKRG